MWLIIIGWECSCRGLGWGIREPGFTQSVFVFTVKIIGVIFYFVDFPFVAGKVGPAVGCDHSSVEVVAISCLCGLYDYCWSVFSSPGSLICSGIWWICEGPFDGCTPCHASGDLIKSRLLSLDFLSLVKEQITQRPYRLWDTPSLLSNGYGTIFPGRMKLQDCETDHSPPSSAEANKGGAILLRFLMFLWHND
jgi:hypothetical protein